MARVIFILMSLVLVNDAYAQHAESINSNAPKALAKLKFCIGKWEIRPQHLGADAPPVGRMNAYWVLDGYALLADYRGLNRNGDVVFRGTSFRTYDSTQKIFTMKWMVAGSEDYTLIKGNFENRDLVTTGKGRDRRGEFIERYRFYDLKPDQFKFKMERSYDSGKTWQTHALNRYNRIE